MNLYESLSSPSFMLNEQIARQVFEVLPDRGPLVLIRDRRGNSWPSDSEEFTKLNINELFLKELCDKIDDGAEPIVTQSDECSIVGAELATERGSCGYVIIALSNYSPESTMVNIDLIEVLLNQYSLIAKLIEKNNLLYEAQMKRLGACGRGQAIPN